MTADVQFVGNRGVVVTVGGETIALRGEPGMSRDELVAAAAARLSTGEQTVIVRKPGDVVIEVPAMASSGAANTPKET